MTGTLDGSRCQLRKERHEGGKSNEVPLRLHVSNENIYQVTDRLKGIERDTDRQREIGQRSSENMPGQRKHRGEHAEVFETEQGQERPDDAYRENTAADARRHQHLA